MNVFAKRPSKAGEKMMEAMVKSIVAGHINRLISGSPMTEGDKRRTHEQLMEALEAADVDTCWRVLEFLEGKPLRDK